MTPGARELAKWGGGAWVVVVVGLSVLFWRGSTLSDLAGSNDKLYSDYRSLYHPETPKSGEFVNDLETDLTKAKELQGQQLELAEAEMVPQLPESYRLVVDRLTENESIVSQDQSMLTSDAMSRGVVLAAKAPYLQLDQDPRVRARQMAELCLYRLVLKCCIDAKVKKVANVTVGKPSIDPTGSYVLYDCRFVVDASFESGQRLIESLAYAAKQGISLSTLQIKPLSADPGQRQEISFNATLITPLTNVPGPSRPGGA